MGGVRRHTEGDDLVIGAVPVELWRSVATIAVYNKKLIDSSCTSSYMLVEVLYLLKA
jgi:hypothetical protein